MQRRAIDLRLGPLVDENDAAAERRTLIIAYLGAWIFGMAMTTIYVTIFGAYDTAYFATMGLLLMGVAYTPVVFNSSINRAWSLVSTAIAIAVLTIAGLSLEQPGINNFLLVALVFSAFFLWRDKKLYLAAWAMMVVAYCALPIMIGGAAEIRRVVIGGSIFTLVGGLSFLLVRRAGKLQLERSTFQSTVSSLLTALNSRDGATRERTLHTVELAEEVAFEMGLSLADREQVRYAAYLHDIGLLGVPNELIDKRGPLSAEEWEVLREHPVIGERIVRSVPGFDDIAVIVRHEHEHWNGSGYPDGLSGDRIPIESRIIQACTAFYQLTSSQPDELDDEAVAAEVAGEMRARAGTHFDPEVVESLLLVASSNGHLRAGRVLELSLKLAG
jgi:HD-GYP domain-containing protein (c-di-GMP phosphodiesterase class II)